MSAVRTYRCPACGGDVDETERHCRYCRAPIATARCGYCFHMNVAEAAHCSGCGRELGLEPVLEPADPPCPDCASSLAVFTSGPGRLYDCASCGGQFVEHALLKDLLERRETYGFRAIRPPQMPLERKVRYVACPLCGELMNRKNFGGTSGVVVDVCARHGLWFDAGELPRVMKFVEEGGLERARNRDEERKRQEEVERRVREATPSMRLVTAKADGVSVVEDLERAGSALLTYVLDALRR